LVKALCAEISTISTAARYLAGAGVSGWFQPPPRDL
jgi:hypothetical protein